MLQRVTFERSWKDLLDRFRGAFTSRAALSMAGVDVAEFLQFNSVALKRGSVHPLSSTQVISCAGDRDRRAQVARSLPDRSTHFRYFRRSRHCPLDAGRAGRRIVPKPPINFSCICFSEHGHAFCPRAPGSKKYLPHHLVGSIRR